VLACGGDPAGGPPQRFAYGEELDLTACNTNKRARDHSPRCNARTIDAAYATCGTNTEPSGAFPRCRSRFGAFDFHGNVAEIMTRWEESDQQTVSQLKGSAFFYVDVVPKKGKERARETYSDHCAHDPRWHVEPMKKAWHVNYHLGFRCCRDVPGAGKSPPP
jgi:sulfatase modifying factor 1